MARKHRLTPLTELELLLRVAQCGGWRHAEVLVPLVSRSSGAAMLDTMRWRTMNLASTLEYWREQAKAPPHWAGRPDVLAVYDVREKPDE